ncbi:MAG TPA: UDP-N-acetylglucosamine 2-epimerase (non-hydrolyzing) [Candidatus Obscuribacterales bacterium]
MKVMTVLGTRPEIIRLSRIISKLDDVCSHVLVHTGQNFDPSLSDVFFSELSIRRPDHYLSVDGSSFGRQAGDIIAKSEEIMLHEKPDRLLVLGDTNSGLSVIPAKRLAIKVFHLEAGNRCYDDRVPEEVNRRIIDHASDVLMPYTERSRANLLAEGIHASRIFVTGNPIYEVINHYRPRIEESTILQDLGLRRKEYFLLTMHRAENVDLPERLHMLTRSLELVQQTYGMPVIVSTHPRTQARMKEYAVHSPNSAIRFLRPFGFFDFLALEQHAFCVMTDSGTVQEECCILQVANVTIRDTTERPETLECGSNILSGAEPAYILQCIKVALQNARQWDSPPEYKSPAVSDTVVNLVLGYRHTTLASHPG